MHKPFFGFCAWQANYNKIIGCNLRINLYKTFPTATGRAVDLEGNWILKMNCTVNGTACHTHFLTFERWQPEHVLLVTDNMATCPLCNWIESPPATLQRISRFQNWQMNGCLWFVLRWQASLYNADEERVHQLWVTRQLEVTEQITCLTVDFSGWFLCQCIPLIMIFYIDWAIMFSEVCWTHQSPWQVFLFFFSQTTRTFV